MDQFYEYKMFFYYVHFRGNAYKGMTIKACLTTVYVPISRSESTLFSDAPRSLKVIIMIITIII